jgi:hypothetical protein
MECDAVVRFVECEEGTVTETDLLEAQREVGLIFPPGLKNSFVRARGGRPEPPLFSYKGKSALVDCTLPLASQGQSVLAGCTPRLASQRNSAVLAYDHLVNRWKAPKNLFPFAYDGAGNLFCVDCDTSTGMVFVFLLDLGLEDQTVPLDVDIDDFWTHMRPDGP